MPEPMPIPSAPRASRIPRAIALVAVALACSSAPKRALPQDDGDSTDDGRHRLDFSALRINAAEGVAKVVFPGYTLTFENELRVGVTLSYAQVDWADQMNVTQAGRTSGWGDTQLVVQWDRSRRITSSPWVPNQLGLYSIVVAPTGQAGLSSELWEVEVGFGTVVFERAHFAFVPSVYYRTTFRESGAPGDEELGISPGLYWVVEDGFWLGYAPNVAYNYAGRGRVFDHRLTLGKLFPSGFGLGFDVTRSTRLRSLNLEASYTGVLNLYYIFGTP
ncbi:MAG: hypothetical protein ACWGPN_03125 [Gammaproteobacteria bacterium]